MAGCGAIGLSECPLEDEPELPGAASSPACHAYSVLREEGSIRIEWSMTAGAEGSEFSIQRSPASRRAYREIREIEAGPEELDFMFFDLSCVPGTAYRYRVVHRPACGEPCILFETARYVAAATPTALHPNRPNPFSVATELRFSVGERAKTSLAIYDVEGRLVRTLANSTFEAGSYRATWNGRDDAGRPVTAGVYFCRLMAGEETISRKLILVR